VGIGWEDIAFQPGPNLASEIGEAWGWLLNGRAFAPFLCSKLGDVFFETDDGSVAWLSCSEGQISLAARNRAEFDALCAGHDPIIDTWFGPGLIERLHAEGKVAAASQCYAFVILPIFAECRYEPDNLNPVAAREVLVGLAETHRQLDAMPDGTPVQIKIVD
jgi:hypothetical protein